MMKIKKGIKKQKKGKVILVIDSGGRGHALAWKIAQSDDVRIVYCAPGNAGTAMTKKCQNVDIQTGEIWKLLKFAKDNAIDLVVFGPEGPLVAGAADIFENNGIKVFGPSLLGAMMEASKEYAKEIMQEHSILTAPYRAFTDPKKAKEFVKEMYLDAVVKADGITGGKGVTVYSTLGEAYQAIDGMMVQKIYGDAGKTVLVEKRLKGKERSLLAFFDGKSLEFCPLVEDYKQLEDGDKGPNTGGIGVESSPEEVTFLEELKMKNAARRLALAMREKGIDYHGIIYFGFMIVDGEAYILEINCRFGDPECQLLMRRMKSDLVPILFACADGNLGQHKIEWDERIAIGVVLVSDGYPGKPQDKSIVCGLKQVARMKDIVVFHNGTSLVEGKVVTKGGRNFTVTSLKEKRKNAVETAYNAVRKMSYTHMKYRTDVGNRKRKG